VGITGAEGFFLGECRLLSLFVLRCFGRELEFGHSNFATDPKQVDVTVLQRDVNVTSQGKGAETNFKVRTTRQGNITLRSFGQAAAIEAIAERGDITITVPGGPYNVVATSGQGTIQSTLTSDPSAIRRITATVASQGNVTIKAS
jgi:hypothetical protein